MTEKRPPTLPTLLNRARAAGRKADAAADAQCRADRAVRFEAERQAIAALARRGIQRKAMIEIAETFARRWNPGQYRLEWINVCPSRKFTDGSPCWRGRVQLTAFNKRGKALITPISCSWDLDHPRDLARMINLVKEMGE